MPGPGAPQTPLGSPAPAAPGAYTKRHTESSQVGPFTHSTAEATEAQGGKVIYPRSHNKDRAGTKSYPVPVPTYQKKALLPTRARTPPRHVPLSPSLIFGWWLFTRLAPFPREELLHAPLVWCGAAERGQCQVKDGGQPLLRTLGAPEVEAGRPRWDDVQAQVLPGATSANGGCSLPSQGQPSPPCGDTHRTALSSAPCSSCHYCDIRSIGFPAPTEARGWVPPSPIWGN